MCFDKYDSIRIYTDDIWSNEMIYYALDFSTPSQKDQFLSWIECTSLIHDYCKLKTPNRGTGGWVWLTFLGPLRLLLVDVMKNFLCRGSFLREINQDEYSLAMSVSLHPCLRADRNYSDYATKSSQIFCQLGDCENVQKILKRGVSLYRVGSFG